jgi:hypothetical protein
MRTSANISFDFCVMSVPQVRESIAKAIALSALLLMVGLANVHAEPDGTKLTVGATVAKHASLQILTQPGPLTITAADIARGYVEVPALASVQVQTNTQNGYLLTFDNQGEFISQILVKGLANDVQMGGAGGGVAQNTVGQGMRRAQLNLGFRFVLAPSVQGGVYPWPVRMSVTPL